MDGWALVRGQTLPEPRPTWGWRAVCVGSEPGLARPLPGNGTLFLDRTSRESHLWVVWIAKQGLRNHSNMLNQTRTKGFEYGGLWTNYKALID